MNEIKVLVVEDDAVACKQLARTVTKAGFSVQTAEDGATGLALFREAPQDVVITDLRMPGVDGMELVHTVKRLSADTEVIVTTAYGEVETAVSLLREGVLDYLKKPIDLDQLILALGRARERVERRRKLPFFPRILLAEDDSPARHCLSRVLKKEGWDVVQASDGQEAVSLFVQEKIDVVLLDIKMPKLDGLDALHAMRQATDDFAAIVLTGYGDEAAAVKAMREGALNFLKKPVDLDQLIASVEKAIQRVRVDRALRYRTRELELAEQIMARLCAGRDVTIDLGGARCLEARAFGRELLDTLPIGLLVVDAAHAVRFANQRLLSRLQAPPAELDLTLIEQLLPGSSAARLLEHVDRMFGGELGQVERADAAAKADITLISLALHAGGKTERAVVLALRG